MFLWFHDTFCDPIPAGTQIPGNTYYNGSIFKGGRCFPRTSLIRNRGVQGKLVVGLTDKIDFTAIAGYRALDMNFSGSYDGTPLSEAYTRHEIYEHHVTGELRLTGRFKFADLVGGLFYYDGTAEHLNQPQNVSSGAQGFGVSTYKPRSWAGYANGVFHVTDRFNVTGGLRYSHDQKGVDFVSQNDATPPGQTTFVPAAGGTIFAVTIEDKRWDWKAGADYFLTDDIMVYASAGSGYRLSGFVVRPWQAGQAGPIPGDALISYEIGAKAEFFDRRLKLNVAAFQMDFTSRSAGYSGQEGQLNGTLTGLVSGNMTVVAAGPLNTPYATAFTTCRPYNAATDGPQNLNTTPDKGVGVTCLPRAYNYQVAGQIRGGEAEVEIEPVDDLLITGSVGYTKWTSEGTSRQTTIPNWTASGGIQYKIDAKPLGGTITPRLDWFFNSTIYYAADFPDYRQDPRSSFNGRISYRNVEHDFDVAIGATNLFNKFYWVNQFPRATFGGTVNAGQPAAPREWYLTLKKRF